MIRNHLFQTVKFGQGSPNRYIELLKAVDRNDTFKTDLAQCYEDYKQVNEYDKIDTQK